MHHMNPIPVHASRPAASLGETEQTLTELDEMMRDTIEADIQGLVSGRQVSGLLLSKVLAIFIQNYQCDDERLKVISVHVLRITSEAGSLPLPILCSETCMLDLSNSTQRHRIAH